MESYLLKDQRIYECTIHSWGEPPYYICFDFLDGAPIINPPWDDIYFNIRILLKERCCHVSNMHLNRGSYTDNAIYDFYNISIKSIKQATNYILSILNVPKENKKSMAQQILYYANNMANNTQRCFRTQFMIVEVNADIFYRNNDNHDRAIETLMKDDQACQTKLASKASNNKLKGVKLQQKEGLGNCTFCSEEFRVDAVQMPCSHLFHGNCIVNWLLKNNNCPTCGFEISSSDDD